LVEGPDIAVVAGVYSERGRMVIDALNAGAHVIADKPLCTDLGELDEIEATAEATGKTVNLMLEKRGYPETLAAEQLVQRGDLGEILGITSTEIGRASCRERVSNSVVARKLQRKRSRE